MRIAWVVLLVLLTKTVFCFEPVYTDDPILIQDTSINVHNQSFEAKHPKLVTAIITVALGPLGGHRLYLHTKPIVPIVYALTLGGGLGLLPVIDLLVITFTKDLDKYRENAKIIMWL